MTFEIAYTLAVIAITVGAVAAEVWGPDVLLVGALVALVAGGVVDVETALEGFSNPALATIAGLFIVAAGIRATGMLDGLADRLLGDARSLPPVLARLSGLTAAGSAFLSNTAVVTMGIPAVSSWARDHGISPSRLLIPLSYASILGGVCTLIGTSTNVVVDGLLRSEGMTGLGFFELAAVGVPLVLVGVGYLSLVAPRLLPGRDEAREPPSVEAKEYLAEMELEEPSPLVGQTVEEAGLRNLPGLFLVRIERDEELISPVSPGDRLAHGDRLTFAGVVEKIVDLRRHRGLEPVATARPPEADPSWELHEAVVAPGSPLVGTTVKEAEFRARYNAAVIAVRRHGEEVEKRIGDITLRPGDTLLMEADPAFERAFRDSTDFFLVSRVEGSEGRKHGKAPRALAVLAAVVVGAATGLVPLPLAALGGGLAMLLTGCLTPGEARRSVDWSVLVAIGAAIGLAGALRASGAAELLGGGLEWVAGTFGPVGLLVGVFAGTVLLTEVVINQAAAALAFPVVVAAAASQGLDPRPLVLTAAVAASMSFSTPLSYQTNLLVYGPGRYRFTDFTRAGVPLQILLGITAVLIIPVVWPLTG